MDDLKEGDRDLEEDQKDLNENLKKDHSDPDGNLKEDFKHDLKDGLEEDPQDRINPKDNVK